MPPALSAVFRRRPLANVWLWFPVMGQSPAFSFVFVFMLFLWFLHSHAGDQTRFYAGAHKQRSRDASELHLLGLDYLTAIELILSFVLHSLVVVGAHGKVAGFCLRLHLVPPG
jgi:hypothetical protein